MEKMIAEVQQLTGLRLTPRQVSAFEIFEHELLEWNEMFNLTAIRDVEGVRTKHFLDSLTCLIEMREHPPLRLIDIGTGAGFPGIPLKIVMPNLHLTLVESVSKKANFCSHMVELLNLENVQVVTKRAEEIGQDPRHREAYDWAVARAVAVLPILAEYLLPLVRVGGYSMAQKGESGPQETHAAERAFQLLGGRLKKITPVNLPGVAEQRFLVVIQKVAATPLKYPRRVGIPSKSPL
ncbi:MAG TPA: 16S rRNA (guanine(527)-N(7))-methyltransferase RsmG [Anaerolineaceae bacterium]|nr:16S rRNA (guanine(527)-N(7))-methyltransferase RsmG [Anaerolineaceae bacterium]